MRVLFTIPHYFAPRKDAAGRKHGSTQRDPRPRQTALCRCVQSIYQLFHPAQCMINLTTKRTTSSNREFVCREIKIVLVTTPEDHLVNALPLGTDAYERCSRDVEPLELGFECQSVLRDHLGQYDFYCYLEDDLMLRDPLFFQKLQWFNETMGSDKLLLPNRYEVSFGRAVYKAYIDGDLPERVVAPFEVRGHPTQLVGNVLGDNLAFQRAKNPHAGCYFLSAQQMAIWSEQDHFLDRSTAFVGPLESAATLGVLRTFPIYKPAIESAAFLEIEHFGEQFLRQLHKPT